MSALQTTAVEDLQRFDDDCDLATARGSRPAPLSLGDESVLRENMKPPRDVAFVITEWGKRAKFCPNCSVEIRWTGYNTGTCTCNA